MSKIIGLLDLNYFYAQCELVRDPSLKEKSVVIVMPSIRENGGVVATCNYEARALKISSGMSLFLAKKLANSETVFINVDKEYYQEISNKVFEILDYFCNKVEQVSIDEAYFDLTNPIGYEKGIELVNKIKKRIKSELNLTCSVGVGPNKLIAKMAAGTKKPDGLVVVREEEVNDFLSKQKLSSLMGVGKVTLKEFNKRGVYSIFDVRRFGERDLVEWFGEGVGKKLFGFAFGRDERVVEPNREKQQLSKSITLREDSREEDLINQNVDLLVDLLYNKIIDLNKNFRTVSLVIVNEKMETITKSRTKFNVLPTKNELKEVLYELTNSFLLESSSFVRRVGVRVSNFEEKEGFQKKIFDY